MNNTILITGASSGIGKATAELFASKGWNVAATMRSPNRSKDAAGNNRTNVRYYAMDVTDRETVERVVKQAVADLGRIDAVLNNAGYGAVGVFEASTEEQIKRQFDTNVFGTMNVIQSVLPYFRRNGAGTIINVTSVGGKVTFPLYSLYHGSKWALEGFSESLHYELKPLGIQVKMIEPGVIKTDFYSRSQELIHDEALSEYEPYVWTVWRNMQKAGNKGASPDTVAKAIYRAATDGKRKLRYAVGSPAPWLLPIRKLLPDSWFFSIIRGNVEKGLKKAKKR